MIWEKSIIPRKYASVDPVAVPELGAGLGVSATVTILSDGKLTL